jgi:16S rRNA (cytosine967-C5)-methyltransferase
MQRDRLQREDLTRQAARQVAILRGALARLATGGRLLYSTCSLEPEENEHVVESVLRAFSGSIRLLRTEPLLMRLADETVLKPEPAEMLIRTAVRGGCLRTLPGIHPCDGFFAALLERAN